MNSSDRIPRWLGWHGHEDIEYVPDPDDIQGMQTPEETTVSDAEDDAFGTGMHPDVDGTPCANRKPHARHRWGITGEHRCSGVGGVSITFKETPVPSMLQCPNTLSPHTSHRWGLHQQIQCPGVLPAVADQFISALVGVDTEDGRPVPDEIRKIAAEVNQRLLRAAAEMSRPPREQARLVAAQARADKARTEYETAERRVWIISQLGEEEPRTDGTAFRVRWRGYDYILFRAGGLWYTTGRTGPHRARWTAVVDWLAAGATGEIVELIGEDSPRWIL